MNDITQALQKAGVKIPPQNQRIWTWLKDNGPHSVVDVTSELKLPAASVRAAITVMVRRKMLEKIERRNHMGERIHCHYGALGKAYMLLPVPVGKSKAKTKVKVADTPPSERLTGIGEAPKFSPELLLIDCTLGEMRQVHDYLRRFFK